jgi:predicted tellurium resistance membrane protein TerC
MSERWKYQLKVGLFWGLFMTGFMLLFEMKEKPIRNQITAPGFYLKLVVYVTVGIFVLGYFNWKQKVKQHKNQ